MNTPEHNTTAAELAKTRMDRALHITRTDMGDLVKAAMVIQEEHADVPELHVVLLQMVAQNLRSYPFSGEQAMKVLVRAEFLRQNGNAMIPKKP